MRIWSKFVDEYFCPALTVIGAHAARHYARKIPSDELASVLARIPLPEVRDKWATIAGASYSAEQLSEARRQLAVCAERTNATLAQSPWLAGSTYSLADINVFSMAIALARVIPEHVNAEATPHLIRWHGQMTSRPAVRQQLARLPRRAD
jgi:glutathione S-transferase